MRSRAKTTSVLSSKTLRTSGALLTAQIAVSRLIESEAVEPTGHDPTTLDLLVRLDQAPDHSLRAVELSRRLLMSPSHISRMIDRAETEGLVKRAPDPEDRRASLVLLTDQGRELLTEFGPLLEGVIERVIHQTLTSSEADTLVELLGRIEEAASRG